MFVQSRSRVARAEALFSEFIAATSRFLQTRPYVVHVEDQPGLIIIWAEVRAVFPRELNLILGDAIHNLRSSLDILANEAISHESDRVQRDAYFPILGPTTKQPEDQFAKLKGASPALVSVIRTLQHPARDGWWLRLLHDLDISDKHKMPLTVVPRPNATVRGAQPRGGTFRATHMLVDPDTLGMQGFMSLNKSLGFVVDPAVEYEFSLAFTADHARDGVTVEVAFQQMLGEVLHSIAAVEALYFTA